MLSHEHRLRKEKDILRTVKSKRGVFDAACGVKFVKNDLTMSRFAIVVGAKVHKSAVQRNRVRRQYREILRLHRAAIAPGYDIALLTAKPALALDYREKEARLLHVLRKAQLLVAATSASSTRDAADSRVSKDAVV